MLLQKVAKEPECYSREGGNPFFSGCYKGIAPFLQDNGDFL
jgi:hypothetical protein